MRCSSRWYGKPRHEANTAQQMPQTYIRTALRLGLEAEAQGQMFTPQAIGFVDSPYKDTAAIPKGLGTKHEAEGILRILHEFELGLTDIEGFSHLMVIWAFDRSHGFDLLGTPHFDDRPHGVFATRSPRRPNPIGLTVVELLRRENGLLHVRGDRHARWNAHPRHQALPIQRPIRDVASRMDCRS